jgi:uncharacterized protein YqjF (DUF2071 family)
MKTIRRPFLTARWSNLAILSYEVPRALLEPHLPAGLTLDMRGGAAFASLVAFDFLDTRVRGIGWPGFRSFPELNLRFYVRQGDRRGVVFIREFVPQPLVSWLARTIYNEPYLVAKIESGVDEEPSLITTVRRLHWHGRAHRIEVTGRRGRTLSYEVRHPLWDVYPVRSSTLDFDWAHVYGSAWGFLSNAKPASVVLAAGSPVSVYPRARI